MLCYRYKGGGGGSRYRYCTNNETLEYIDLWNQGKKFKNEEHCVNASENGNGLQALKLSCHPLFCACIAFFILLIMVEADKDAFHNRNRIFNYNLSRNNYFAKILNQF